MIHGDEEALSASLITKDSDVVLDCCIRTINEHAINNPMMVCENCKQIVKVFSSESSFRNYSRFCNGRGRIFRQGDVLDYKVVTFHIYDTFNK